MELSSYTKPNTTLSKQTLRTLLHSIKPRTLGKDATAFDIGIEAHKVTILNIIAKDLGINEVNPVQQRINELGLG